MTSLSAGAIGRTVLLIAASVAILYGGYAALGHMRTRQIAVCAVSDVQYRLLKPDWQAETERLFVEVNRFFAKTGVRFRVSTGGDAYAERNTGSMAQRWQLVSESSCKADIVVGFTGQVGKDDTAVAIPFSHAALIRDTGGNTEAMKATVVARSLANLFGVPVGTQASVAMDNGDGELFDQGAIEIIRQMRGFDFAHGAEALQGKWERRAVAALAENLARKNAHPESEAHRIISRSYAAARSYTDAVRHLRDAVRLDPQNADLRFELAMQLEAAADSEAAITELREVTRMEPENALAHAAMGTIFLNSRRTDEAIEEWRTAARLDPRDASFQVALGAALTERPGMLQQAAEAFDAAVRLRPSDVAGYYGLARDNALGARVKEGVEKAAAEVQRNPSSADARVALAAAYGDAGNQELARREAQRALEIDPRNGHAHLLLAELHFLAGEYAAAQSEVTAANAAGLEARRGLIEGIQRKLRRD